MGMIRFGVCKDRNDGDNEDENEDVWGEERRKGFENEEQESYVV